jgi:hypothetical protein
MIFLTFKSKSFTQAMPEQRTIVKFLFKEGKEPPKIIQRFENVSGDRAMKKTQVYFWIAEICRGREDLSDEEIALLAVLSQGWKLTLASFQEHILRDSQFRNIPEVENPAPNAT